MRILLVNPILAFGLISLLVTSRIPPLAVFSLALWLFKICIMCLVNGQIDAHKSQWCVLKDAPSGGEKRKLLNAEGLWIINVLGWGAGKGRQWEFASNAQNNDGVNLRNNHIKWLCESCRTAWLKFKASSSSVCQYKSNFLTNSRTNCENYNF